MKLKINIFILIFSFIISNAFAVIDNPPKDSSNIEKDTAFHKRKFVAFPFILAEPETGVGAGLAGLYFFKTHDGSDKLVRTSSIALVGMYTWNKQSLIASNGNIYFPEEKYILRWFIAYTNFPDRFWGLGNNSPDQVRQLYTYESSYLNVQPTWRFYRRWFLGVNYEYQNIYKVTLKNPNDPENIFFTQDITGRTGGITSGLGPILSWDSRNGAFWPTKGEYFQFVTTLYSRIIGSQFNFASYLVDFRKFIKLNKKQDVLAFQLYGNFTNGTIPFRQIPALGGPNLLRGLWYGRFRDRQLMAGQIEYRKWLWWRFGAVAFLAAGEVGNRISDFTIPGIHLTGGLGIRFTLLKEDKANLRLDFGFAGIQSGFYVNFMEAF